MTASDASGLEALFAPECHYRDMLAFSYILVGKKLFVSGYFNTTTVGGTPDTDLRVKIPGGFTANDLVIDIARVKDNAAAYAAGVVYTLVAGTTINFQLIVLTASESTPAIVTTDYRVVFFSMNWEQELIVIHVRGTNGERKEFRYEKAIATSFMIALNKMDLSVKSLQRRILERLSTEGKLVGSVSGSPD